MSVISLRWALDPEVVRDTPAQQGVFTLWDGNECVYVGHTGGNVTLRDRINVFLGLVRQGAIDATHYTWETTVTPKTREGDLLSLLLEKYGKLPRYNRPESALRFLVQPDATDLRARRP